MTATAPSPTPPSAPSLNKGFGQLGPNHIAGGTLARELGAAPPEMSPFGDATTLGPGGPRYSPSVHELLTRVAGMPSASFFLDPTADALLVATASGNYAVAVTEVPTSDGEKVKVVGLRRLPADSLTEEETWDLLELGGTAVGQMLASMVTDQIPGMAPDIEVAAPAAAAQVAVDLTDTEDPFAQGIRDAVDSARENVLDRAVDDNAGAAAEFVRVWNEALPDMPMPVAASGQPAPRLSQFRKVDVASLTAIRRDVDAFASASMSQRTSQRALSLKLRVRESLAASGLGEAEVRWVEAAYGGGTRSAHTRGGGGMVGEVIGGTYVAVDAALALAAASLRSREAVRQVLGIRASRGQS